MRKVLISLFALGLGAMILSPLRGLAQVTPGAPSQTATITGTVQTDSGTFVAGAAVKLTGASFAQTVTDAHGTFVFTSVPYGRYTIVVTAANLGTASKENIVVNTDTSVTVSFSATQGMKTIARVTAGARTTINTTPASVTTISPSDFAFQGHTSWRTLMENIPGVAAGGGVIQGDSPALYVSASPFFPTIITINGAQPYESATLLDGMPIYLNSNGFAPVGCGSDLSSLPMNGFQAADIIRGPGADSPSIVDSIGGTFELHAPGQVTRNHFEFSASNDAYGGDVVNSKLELRLGKLSAHITYGMASSQGPEHGNFIPGRGAILFNINGQPQNCPGGFLGECINYLPDGYDFGDDQYLGYPVAFDHFEVPLVMCCFAVNTGWNSHNGSAGLSYQVSPNVTAYVNWAGSQQTAVETSPYWAIDFEPGSLGSGAGNLYDGNIPAGNHNFIGAEYENQAHSAVSLWEEKIEMNLGNMGTLRVAALQGYSTYREILIEPPSGTYKVWGTACLGASSTTCTPTAFNGTNETLTDPYGMYNPDQFLYWTNNRDLSAAWQHQVGPNSHVGVSYVQSYYNAPQLDSEGVIGTYGGYSNAISNSTDEVRMQFGGNISDKLGFNLSEYLTQTRYHVPDPNAAGQITLNPTVWSDPTASYAAPRLGLTWRSNSNIVFRGAAGGGFAIAPIQDLVGSNSTPSCFNGTCTEQLTNLKLQPEKSFGFDIGTDMRFNNSTVVSVDLYRNNLYGQFFDSSLAAGLYQNQFLYITEYRNLNHSITEGVNFDIRHDVPHGIYWHAAVGLTRGYIPTGSLPAGFYNGPGGVCTPTTLTYCINQNIIPELNSSGSFSGLARIPYSNGNIQIGYRWNPRKFIEVSPTFLGQNNPYFVPGFTAVDFHAGYPITKNVTLYGVFQNVTGIHDEPYAINNPNTIMGLPTVAGLPTQEALPAAYQPRTFLLTVNFSE